LDVLTIADVAATPITAASLCSGLVLAVSALCARGAEAVA